LNYIKKKSFCMFFSKKTNSDFNILYF